MLLGDELRAEIPAAYEEAADLYGENEPVSWAHRKIRQRSFHVYAAGRQLGAEEERNQDR